MGKVNEIEGDLIKLAKTGYFDVITHGCNCFCSMGAGIAVPMANTFRCDKFELENPHYRGDIQKLGNIDYQTFVLGKNAMWNIEDAKNSENEPELTVVNSYSQYGFGGKFGSSSDGIPFNYSAFTMCMAKINGVFKGKHIGLPQIGAGLAGGDWDRIKGIIETELKDCDVTIVYFNSKI